jgi:hypothetical protein
VLAAVAVGAGLETSGTCSRFTSVRSSFEGVILTSGSSNAVGSSIGVVSAGISIGAGGGGVTSGSFVGGSIDSSDFAGSAGLVILLAKTSLGHSMTAYFSKTGSGAFLGAGAGTGANMLAQLFLTPSGMMLEVAFDTVAAAEDTGPVAVATPVS